MMMMVMMMKAIIIIVITFPYICSGIATYQYVLFFSCTETGRHSKSNSTKNKSVCFFKRGRNNDSNNVFSSFSSTNTKTLCISHKRNRK